MRPHHGLRSVSCTCVPAVGGLLGSGVSLRRSFVRFVRIRCQMAAAAMNKQQLADDWAKNVKVLPENGLVLDREKPAKVKIVNESDRTLAFKIRTTRFDDVKPTAAIGIVQPSGKVDFNVAFKPTPNARPWNEKDRITVLMNELPPGAMSPEQFWKGRDSSQSTRFVVQLKQPSEKKSVAAESSAGSGDTEEEESEEETEESESESEDE